MARTELHQATWSGDRTQARIDEGFDVNEADGDGLTPLHMACMKPNYDAAKALLDAGAAVDPQDKWGNTPLNRAVHEKDAEDLVRLLVERGANPTIENHYGHSPLSEAHRFKFDAFLKVFQGSS